MALTTMNAALDNEESWTQQQIADAKGRGETPVRLRCKLHSLLPEAAADLATSKKITPKTIVLGVKISLI